MNKKTIKPSTGNFNDCRLNKAQRKETTKRAMKINSERRRFPKTKIFCDHQGKRGPIGPDGTGSKGSVKLEPDIKSTKIAKPLMKWVLVFRFSILDSCNRSRYLKLEDF